MTHMTQFSSDVPFVSDADAAAYFEAFDIDYSWDDTKEHVEQVTLNDSDDVDGLLKRLCSLESIRKLFFAGHSATADRMGMLATRHPQIVRLQIEDTGHVSVAVYE